VLIISSFVGNAGNQAGNFTPCFLSVFAPLPLLGMPTLCSGKLAFVFAEKLRIPDFLTGREGNE